MPGRTSGPQRGIAYTMISNAIRCIDSATSETGLFAGGDGAESDAINFIDPREF